MDIRYLIDFALVKNLLYAAYFENVWLWKLTHYVLLVINNSSNINFVQASKYVNSAKLCTLSFELWSKGHHPCWLFYLCSVVSHVCMYVSQLRNCANVTLKNQKFESTQRLHTLKSQNVLISFIIGELNLHQTGEWVALMNFLLISICW